MQISGIGGSAIEVVLSPIAVFHVEEHPADPVEFPSAQILQSARAALRTDRQCDASASVPGKALPCRSSQSINVARSSARRADGTRLSGTAGCAARRVARGRRGRIDPTSCGSSRRDCQGSSVFVFSPQEIVQRGRDRFDEQIGEGLGRAANPIEELRQGRAGSGRHICPRMPRRWLDRYRRERARTCGSRERPERRTSAALGHAWSVSEGSRSPRRWFAASGRPPVGRREPAARSPNPERVNE